MMSRSLHVGHPNYMVYPSRFYFARRMKDLAQHERELLLLLREHTRLTPTQALTTLGWTKDQLAVAKTDLASKGLIRLARGRSMVVDPVSLGDGPTDPQARTP